MALISRRICHVFGVNDEELTSIVKQLNAFLEAQGVPENCFVDVYKDKTACCGYFATGVAVEIQAPEKLSLDDLNRKLADKFIEICDKQNIEHHCDCDQTSCDPVEVI